MGVVGFRSGLLEDSLELLLEVIEGLLRLVDRDIPSANERFGVVLSHGPLGIDDRVHEWLGERGIIGLVVPALAEADEIDDDILGEGLTELEGEPGHPHNGLGILAIHVENRCLHRPGYIRRVHRGSAVLRARRESDLVVHDDVQRAAGAVALDLRHLQGLSDHALPGERSIAVHEHGKDVKDAISRQLVLLRAHDPLEYRVDRLEVRGVGG